MEFIFMLTREDRTIEDCVELYETIRAVPLRHVGFKDIGVGRDTLHRLHDRIKEDGRTSHLEVVSTSRDDCQRSAELSVRLGIDCLLGGTDVADVLAILAGSRTGYYPYPGIPEGHPTRLRGSPQRIAADTAAAVAQGCAGIDLLAYRALEADPLELIRAARAAMDRTLIVAGSINSPERVRGVGLAGADLFTIGSAALDGSFRPRHGLLANQLHGILDACRAA